MSKEIKKEKNPLSSALRNNLKLRKKQLSLSDKNNIPGKRVNKIGVFSLTKIKWIIQKN